MNPYEPPRQRDELKLQQRTGGSQWENALRGAAITVAFLSMMSFFLLVFLVLPWGPLVAAIVAIAVTLFSGIHFLSRGTVIKPHQPRRRRWNDLADSDLADSDLADSDWDDLEIRDNDY